MDLCVYITALCEFEGRRKGNASVCCRISEKGFTVPPRHTYMCGARRSRMTITHHTNASVVTSTATDKALSSVVAIIM